MISTSTGFFAVPFMCRTNPFEVRWLRRRSLYVTQFSPLVCNFGKDKILMLEPDDMNSAGAGPITCWNAQIGEGDHYCINTSRGKHHCVNTSEVMVRETTSAHPNRGSILCRWADTDSDTRSFGTYVTCSTILKQP